mmetsp:Transcript_27387/g.78925  ORF Transcript_27387/g.78925 Transcript_27387/m.78925 type:complete len:248 (+) Transcript_27387:1682-2425(+)
MSVGLRPSGSKSIAFLDMAKTAFSPTSICFTASVQAGDVCGSPSARTSAPPSCSGYVFLSSTTSIRRKARCLLSHGPSRHCALAAQPWLPGDSTFFFSTSPSPSTGRTTSFFGFFGLGGSSFLIMVCSGTGGLVPSEAFCGACSSAVPSRGSATSTAPSGTLLGSPMSGLMSSSSRPSQVSRICLGGTRRLYFRFSLRWPGVEFGSTGTFTSPLGRTTFSCMGPELPRPGRGRGGRWGLRGRLRGAA